MRRGLLSVLLLVAACSSSKRGPATTVTETPSTTSTVSTPPPDPNIAACEKVHSYVLSHVIPTFDRWHPDTDEFDMKVAGELRDEATHLFTLETTVTGAPAAAVHAEAKALTDISIAIEEQDGSALGDAANAGNSALASLRGSCNF